MANYNRLIRNLQTAILSAGGMVKVNTYQFHSRAQSRMVTCYSVIAPVRSEFKRKIMYRELLKTCSAVEVVKFLADMLEGLRNETEP